MATVELRLSALPAHVRTARLVAAAVARRAGVDEALLDEVRLAVGEACSRAVALHRRACPTEPVVIRLDDGESRFAVAVRDRAPQVSDGDENLAELADASDLDPGALTEGVGLAVISGLVDELEVVGSADGAEVRMTWPTTRRGA